MGSLEAMSGFVTAAGGSPWSYIFIGLVALILLVNGWTDAPNAICTCVASGALRMKDAVVLAALCNLAGTLIMTLLHGAVAGAIYDMVDLGQEPRAALAALSAALLVVALWAAAAWWLGIPTSESHGLIAGLSGAAAALGGGVSAINFSVWGKVLLGMVLSVAVGFLGGFITTRRLGGTGDRKGGPGTGSARRGNDQVYRKAQWGGAAVMAFAHGAQDGQKFIGVLLLGLSLSAAGAEGESGSTATGTIPLWAMIFCALFIALGTAMGGRRIIQKVGIDMVSLDLRSGLAADLGAGLTLLFLTLLGYPVSTTHAKVSAIMGAGRAGGRRGVDKRLAGEIIYTWLLTFPFCGVAGYLAARLFISFL